MTGMDDWTPPSDAILDLGLELELTRMLTVHGPPMLDDIPPEHTAHPMLDDEDQP